MYSMVVRMADHIAELGRNAIGMILSGKRKITPVFLKKPLAPFKSVNENDVVYLRSVDGYAVAKAIIKRVEHYENLTPEKAEEIINKYRDEIHPDEVMLSNEIYSKYATLIWLDNVQEIPPFRVIMPPNVENTKWITVNDIGKVRGY